MTPIHFFDVAPSDTDRLRQLAAQHLPGQTIQFHDGPVAPVTDAVVISPFVSSPVTAELIAAMPALKLIATRSTGYDHIDLSAAAKAGAIVTNVPTYGENTVAEYAFGLLLALVRKIPQAASQLRAGNTSHQDLQGFDLQGKTLGIIGAGRIGCHMARIARGFGMTVVAYDAKPDPTRATEYGFSYAPLDQVLSTADVISLHVPNIPDTKHLINDAALAKLKPTAVLVNTARGEVVDTTALIQALSDHHLAGAALDVFEGEAIASLPDELEHLRAKQVDQLVLRHSLNINILQKLPNVILTNHNAFNTVEAVARINTTTLQNIAAYLAGTPQNEVKPS